VAGLLQLGADADSAWRELLDDPVLAPVARTAARSVRSGAKLADGLERLAVQLRADLIGERRSHAQRVGIWAMAPLGLCFLPAFICIGIVPVIAGIAHDVLPGVLR
jgi:pilus assembly protein TadC